MNSKILESMLRYLYNEMLVEEMPQFWLFLENNPSSMKQFISLREGMEALSSISYTSSRRSLSKILSYASMGGFSMQ